MIVDLILLGLLALAAINGWRSGAIAMLLSVAILIAAGIVASLLAQRVGDLVGLGPSSVHPVIGFIVAFLVLMIAGGWVKHLFRPKHGILRGFDGLAGAILGFARGAFLLGVFLTIFRLIHLPPENTTNKSVIYPVLLKTSSALIGVLRPYIHPAPYSEHVSV